MPFDAATTHVQSDTILAQIKRSFAAWIRPEPKPLLERIRLTPVPLELAEAHKREVEAAFAAACRCNPILRQYQTRASWMTIGWSLSMGWPGFIGTVGSHLRYSFYPSRGTQTAPIEAVIPKPVQKLATDAVSRMRRAGVKANVQAEIFWTDPILHLVWQEDHETRKVCLAIWDYDASGKVVMHEIAKLG